VALGTECRSWWHRPGDRQAADLTGAAATEADAIALRDGFRKQISEHTRCGRTSPSGYCWLSGWPGTRWSRTCASYGLVIDKFILPALGGPAGCAAAVSRSRMPKQVVQMITKPPEIP
jgi:hypothetical protein